MNARRIFSVFLATLVVALLLPGSMSVGAPTLAASSETELVASADSEIRSDSPSANYGSQNGMFVGYSGYDTYGRLRALVRFDNINLLPADAIIDQAVLRLYCRGGTQGDSPMSVTAYAVTQGWSEVAVTWNSHAEQKSGPYGTAVLPEAVSAGYEAVWDVRALVQSWVGGSLPNYGIMLIGDESEATSLYLRRFETRESSTPDQRPRLLVRWHRPGEGAEFNSVADAAISMWNPSKNYGGSELRVAFLPRLFDDWRVLVRFDLAGIPQGAVIDEATLNLHLTGFYGCFAGYEMLSVGTFRVTADWSEATVTWDSHASQVGEAYSTWYYRCSFEPEPEAWDVRPLVQSWVDGTYPNYGLMLVGGVTALERDAGAATFSSREDPDPWIRPYLWVRWHMAATPTPTNTPTWTATPTQTPTSTPTATPRGRQVWLPILLKP